MPRFMLCRTVRYVVAMLIRTKMRMTIFACSGTSPWANRNLSATVTPRILACWALSTICSVSPYLGAWPGFHSAIAFSTLNSAKNTGSWRRREGSPSAG